MKLGTLRFSRRHRAARAARTKRLADARARFARLTGLTFSKTQLDGLRGEPSEHRWSDLYEIPIIDIRSRYPVPPIKPGDLGVMREPEPPRRRSWWERLTGGRTTDIYWER